MFDSHMHSKNSHDSKQTLDEICLNAIEKGLTGITVTDHADINFYESRDTYNNIKNSIADIYAAKEKYKDKLKVLCGVELGEYLSDPKNAEEILTLTQYDLVIGSVHFVDKAKWDRSYTKIVFDETVSDDEIMNYLKLYFEQVSKTIDAFSFDVLAHLTCPMRYINGRYKRNIEVMCFEKEITDILKKIISKSIALEVNTAGLCDDFGNQLIPDERILRIYRELGGELITLGSDCHRPVKMGWKIKETKDTLKELGFSNYYYYENRKPIKVTL